MNISKAGVVIAVCGLLISLGLLFFSARSTPSVVLVFFIGWVALPFVILLFCYLYFTRWSDAMGRALVIASLVVTVGSVAAYLIFTVWPLSSTPARPWLIVPAISLIPIIALLLVAYRTRKS